METETPYQTANRKHSTWLSGNACVWQIGLREGLSEFPLAVLPVVLVLVLVGRIPSEHLRFPIPCTRCVETLLFPHKPSIWMLRTRISGSCSKDGDGSSATHSERPWGSSYAHRDRHGIFRGDTDSE
eukprot:540130-Rhodomonas_salina.3